nr:hypothetical protein [Tanacetum cinerariifolium]
MAILNTLDSLGKFDGKVDKGFLVGYSVSSKAFKVFNSRTRIAQETLHVNFLENKPNVAGCGPTWLFDIDTLTKSMNYQPITPGNQSNPSAGVQEQFHAEKAREENDQQFVLFPVWSFGSTNPQNTNGDVAFDEKEPKFEGRKPESEVNVSPSSKFEDFYDNSINEVNAAGTLVSAVGQLSPNSTNTFSATGPSNDAASHTHGKSSCIDTSQLPNDPNMPKLEDITYSNDEDHVGAEADFNNLETSITVNPIPTTRVHKDHPVTQIIADLSLATQTRSITRVAKDQGGLSQINNDDFHTCMFACFLSQEEPKRSAFLYETIEEEVYVCQPPRFVDPDYPDKVYKVVKALYGLHQAPRAWKFGLTEGKSASTPIYTEKPLLKDPDGEDIDVHTYRSMIGSLMYLTSLRPDIMFAVYVVLSGMESLKRMLHVTNILSAGYLTTPQMVFNSPCLTHIKNWLVQIERSLSWLVQKQMALGKDESNSFIVDSLLKTIWVKTITSLPKIEKVGVEVSAVDLQVSAVRLILLLEGLNQIIDFLNGSSIKYALTMNHNIYVSCIKQFWTTVAVKKVNDVTRLQALVDKKKVIITEATIRDALRLDDAEGVDCLPIEEIFAELARMGYEKPSTKLTFYKTFFSSQWKFLIRTILQCMSVKRTLWNEFSSSMTSAVICLSTGKGFSRVDTPLFEGMLVAHEVGKAADEVHAEDVNAAGVVAEGAASDDVNAVVVEPSIPSHPPPTQSPPPSQDIPSTSQA